LINNFENTGAFLGIFTLLFAFVDKQKTEVIAIIKATPSIRLKSIFNFDISMIIYKFLYNKNRGY